MNSKTKNREQAISDYQKTIQLAPNNAVAQKNLSLLIDKSKYALFPPVPVPFVENDPWVAQMRSLYINFDTAWRNTNYLANKKSSSHEELCKKFTDWVSSANLAAYYAHQLSLNSRGESDKKSFLNDAVGAEGISQKAAQARKNETCAQ